MPGLDANTKLLLHADGGDTVKSAFSMMHMEDNTDVGSGANAVTNIGTPTYTAGKGGGLGTNALTLDGSTDALNLDALFADITTDTSGSISMWFRTDDYSKTQTTFSLGKSTLTTRYFRIIMHSSGTFQVSITDNVGAVQWMHQTAATVSDNTWHHVVVVQDGTSPKVYFDGADITTLTDTTDTTYWFNDETANWDAARIGRQVDSGTAFWFDGQIDEFRYFKNSTLSQTEVDYLYDSFNGTEDSIIVDSSLTTPHTEVQTFADAQLDTAVKKWGTASLIFDGTGDYDTIPDSPDWDVFATSTESWTIDFWAKFTDHTGTETIFDQSDVVYDTANRHFLRHADGSGFTWRVRTAGVSVFQITSASEITDTNWHHVALIKIATDHGLYVDGVQGGYTSSVVTDTFTGVLTIGATSSPDFEFDGHIDEFRFQKSNYFSAAPVVGLTDTITVPTEAYAEDIVAGKSQAVIIA